MFQKWENKTRVLSIKSLDSCESKSKFSNHAGRSLASITKEAKSTQTRWERFLCLNLILLLPGLPFNAAQTQMITFVVMLLTQSELLRMVAQQPCLQFFTSNEIVGMNAMHFLVKNLSFGVNISKDLIT